MSQFRCLFFIICTQPLFLCAQVTQHKSIYVVQMVRDSFTKYGIPDVYVTLADTNGVLIDTIWTRNRYGSHEAKAWGTYLERKPQTFIVKAEHPDYETSIQRLEMKNPRRLSEYIFPDLEMKRKLKETVMSEVTVKATRVQLAYKGDTIVADARAFRIPDGSMLDALVASVPGAELKDDGTIYMNGRKVDYLTLNGKDFFKGKNRIMLDNLPHYIVSKLKFYEKDMPRGEMLRPETGEKDYVMDVELKPEYSTGYTANVEAGYGTGDRWVTRLFGLRFTKYSRLVVFGGANNKNEVRPLSMNGFNDSSTQPYGEKKTEMLGAGLSVDDKDGVFKNNLEGYLNWSHSRNETRTSLQTFLPDGNVYSRLADITKNKDFGSEINNKFELKKHGLKFETKGNFNKSNGRGLSHSATFNDDPSVFGSFTQVMDSLNAVPASTRLQGMTINRVLNHTKYDQQAYAFKQNVSWSKDLPSGDGLWLYADGRYGSDSKDGFSRYSLVYPNGTIPDNKQDRYRPYAHHGYSYNAQGRYLLSPLKGCLITYVYSYNQQYDNTKSDLFRLDTLGSEQEFGMLPSQVDYLRTIDVGNSYQSLYMTKTHKGYLSIYKSNRSEKRNCEIQTYANVYYKDESVRYWRSNTRNDLGQGNWYLEPGFYFTYNNNRKKSMGILNKMMLHYNSSVQTPYLVQRLDITDTSNPLAIVQGNPDLKLSQAHSIKFSTETGGGSANSHIRMTTNFLRNQTANGFSYNSATGVYTYRPENVNGNWNFYGTFFHQRHLDRSKNFQLECRTVFNFVHNVDLARVEGFSTSQLSRVNHYNPKQEAKLSYNKESLRLDMGGGSFRGIWWSENTTAWTTPTPLTLIMVSVGSILCHGRYSCQPP